MKECKYCHKTDAETEMHKDKLTSEYYHEECCPKLKDTESKNFSLKLRRLKDVIK